MGLTVSEGAGSFELAPAGTHPARCYRITDMGTQSTDYQGETKHQRKVLIGFELLGDERMSDGRPFSINKRYTASLHEKAQLRKDLAAWRGRDFTPDELKGFELPKVLGAFVLLNLIHVEKNGKDYCNIASIMPLPKSMPKPEGVNELLTFDLEKFDQAAFVQLSPGLQEKITASPEFKPLPANPPRQRTCQIHRAGLKTSLTIFRSDHDQRTATRSTPARHRGQRCPCCAGRQPLQIPG